MYAKVFVDDYQPKLARLLGLPEGATELDVHTYIVRGIPLDHVANLQKEMPMDLHAIGGVNLVARMACKQAAATALPEHRLSVDEGDRLLRGAHMLVIAEALFGDRDKARRWLATPKQRFGGSTPVDLLSTYTGTRMVEELLVQMAEGFVL